MHWETKKNLDLLYCDNCFIVVVWNQPTESPRMPVIIYQIDGRKEERKEGKGGDKRRKKIRERRERKRHILSEC